MCVAVLGTALAAGLPCRSDAGSELTLEAALALARQRSPRILAARGRAGEAEARLRVRPPLRDNPLVEGAWGSRRGASPSDFEVGLSQTFELGGRSGARRAVDEASLARDRADAG
jgi:cobalt-zinc-cadmium efflux system outer membrane protein